MGTQAGLVKTFVKPVVNGGVSAAAMSALFPGKRFNMGDTSIGVGPYGFVLGAASSFLTNTLTTWVLPYVVKNPAAQKFESMVLELGTSAAIFVAAPRFLTDGELDTMDNVKLAGTGAVAEFAASYAYSHLVSGSGSVLGLPGY